MNSFLLPPVIRESQSHSKPFSVTPILGQSELPHSLWPIPDGPANRTRPAYSPTAISTTARPSSSTQTPQGPPRSLVPRPTTLPSMRSTGW